MNYKQIIDPVVYLQAHFCILFMKRHNLHPHDFIELNESKNIIGFLRLGYEAFHLTGDEGVLEELDSFVFNKAQN